MSPDSGDDFQDGARVGADPDAAASRPREPTASSGFGSPGSDFTVKRIDLNEALIRQGSAMAATGSAGGSRHEVNEQPL